MAGQAAGQLHVGKGLLAQATAFGPDDKMGLHEFTQQLQTIDKGLRSLPATAQVSMWHVHASQRELLRCRSSSAA